jgi:putative endopeptidase
VVRNLDEFVDAFEVDEGDGMWLAEDERVRIW